MPDNAIGITGADGYTPIYNPTARWRMWGIHDIYIGEIGNNKYIPNVLDYVVEPETGNMFMVTDLNNVTFIPELTPVTLKQNVEVDSILSSTNDNYRIYYDTTITPFVLAVDGFMRVYSSSATIARIYKGEFIDPSKIISRRYSNTGDFIGHDIPLEVVAFNSHDNFAIKSIPTCATNANLQEGDICSIVVFDSNGKVITKTKAIVENTTYVAQAFSEQRYVTQIFMKNVFIPDTTDNRINYPVNLPITSFNPIGVVQYNDGTQIEYPVDGDKFRLYGLDQFVSTIIGHRVPLVLAYRLDSNEAAVVTVESDNFYVTRPYELIVSDPNRSYNVKLFVYPVWVDAISGYNYKAFLMNLDRNAVFDVTSVLSLSPNSAPLNPLAYGVSQRITFNLNLANVSGIYNNFLHVQTVDIILRAPASDLSINNLWEVGTQVPTTIPYYGANLIAIRSGANNTKVRIDSGIQTVEEFVTRVYRHTIPLHNPLTELEAPEPTHIEVRHLGESITVPIAEYTNEFTFVNPINNLGNIEIIFLKETINTFIKLSIASMLVR